MAQDNGTSGYAAYNAAHGVKPLSAYIDQDLVALVGAACKKENVTKTAYIETAMIKAVRASGFEYTPKSPTASAQALKEQLAAKEARIAELEAKLAEQETKTTIVPTPPTQKADARGHVYEKDSATA